MDGPPIFVVGTARSGTTLLQAALGAHHRIAGPPEVHFILRIARLADYYGDLADDANLRRAVHDTVDTPLLHPLGIDEEEVLRRAERARTYAGLLDALMSTIATSWGKVRWSEKTPGQPAHEIWALFPDAQVVHIVRDPVAVIASHRRTPLRQVPVRVAATHWTAFNRATREAGSRAGPDRYTMVRYETLVEHPEATLREVCSFLGEPFDPKMLTDRSESQAVTRDAWWQQGATGAIRPSSSSTRDLGRVRRAVITAIARRDLPAFGYPTPHPLAVAVGRGLNVAARAVERTRRPPAPPVLSPAERHELVQRQMAERLAALAGETRRSS
jgi:hypothetical protein